MTRRGFLAALTAAGIAGGSDLLARAIPQPHEHHAPWDSPVASSQTFASGGATFRVDFSPGQLDLPNADVLQWVRNAAAAVTTYYGRYPVPRDRVLIVPVSGDHGVMQGTTWGDVGGFPAFTRIHVGQHTTVPELRDDWMMTHELVHAAFPSQEDAQHWIEEGLAVYVEPIARVQAGLLRPGRIWGDMFRDMRKGDPQPGDEGLDRTHTWGRTYWGGAQFCLLADVTIREQTHNRKGLQDALRAVVAAGGTIDHDWPIQKAFAIGDAATGTRVLEEQYAAMSDTPVTVDLEAIWKKLGVVRTADGIRLDDAATEASVRRAITAAPATGGVPQ